MTRGYKIKGDTLGSQLLMLQDSPGTCEVVLLDLTVGLHGGEVDVVIHLPQDDQQNQTDHHINTGSVGA
jgi:hypothetical protein